MFIIFPIFEKIPITPSGEIFIKIEVLNLESSNQYATIEVDKITRVLESHKKSDKFIKHNLNMSIVNQVHR